MIERLFLCGLSDAQRAEYKGGRELHLHGPRKNVRLKLDDVRKRLLEVETDLLADLAEIAVYIFAADCAIRRGGLALKRMGERWRRTFRLVVAVRKPGRWQEPRLLHALRDALQFLSDDTWSIEFVVLENPPSIQDYLGLANADVERSGGSTILLFSGGLDSFAGAVQELNSSNRHVVLMSRRLGGMTDRRQRELSDELKHRYPRRVTHVPVDAGLMKDTEAVEHTQRTRSFLLAVLATVGAAIEQSDRIRFFENGIMSVNLPISTQVVGARASRSTHPRSLMLLEGLVRLVGNDEVRIDNPFIWLSKVEVVRELKERLERESIRFTLSCSRTRGLSKYAPHCGSCAQCLQRRISILGADAAEDDSEEGYAVDLMLGPRQDDEERVMAVDMVRSALEYRRLSEAGFATRFAGEFAWLTTSFPGQSPASVAQKFVSMFKNHGDAVREILIRTTEEHAAALVDKTLPESCLLRMVHDFPAITFEDAAIEDYRPADHTEEGDGATQDLPESTEIMIAVDQARKRILFDGITPISGPTDFRVLSVLVRLYSDDREAGRLPENYQTLAAADLADRASSTGDIAGRKAVHRLRQHIKKEFAQLYGKDLDLNAVVENVPGKGYRLNPAVRVVASAELER